MLTEDELSKDLLKKTNYSKNKRKMKCQHIRTNWFWREWSQLVETRIQTDFILVRFFFVNATNTFTKHLPAIALHSRDSKFSRLSQKL